ncbi:MAG TPA: phage tail assembly chaperone [Rhizomicrobium sp.]|nr:phage tail assembly chaperone [Rhizomicrobium sp.]
MGLSPRDFWAMSLPEWRAAVAGFRRRRGHAPSPPLARAEFDALMARFPDETR